MLIEGFHHYSLTCSSLAELDKTISFYCDVLGMSVAKRMDNGAMISFPGGMVEVFANGGGTTKCGAVRHIAFAVSDAAACVSAVKSAGFEVFLGPKEIQIPMHAVIAFCYGPLGEQLEFFQCL